jgi:hypothetical protein
MTPLTETHGTRFELVRHFLSRSLASGDWSRVAAGAMAMLASGWILLAGVLLFKYKRLAELNLQDRFQAEARADVTSLTLMAVAWRCYWWPCFGNRCTRPCAIALRSPRFR